MVRVKGRSSFKPSKTSSEENKLNFGSNKASYRGATINSKGKANHTKWFHSSGLLLLLVVGAMLIFYGNEVTRLTPTPRLTREIFLKPIVWSLSSIKRGIEVIEENTLEITSIPGANTHINPEQNSNLNAGSMIHADTETGTKTNSSTVKDTSADSSTNSNSNSNSNSNTNINTNINTNSNNDGSRLPDNNNNLRGGGGIKQPEFWVEVEVASNYSYLGEEQKVNIYVDWPYPRSAFGAHNYRSLESILHHHPNATVRLAIIGPDMMQGYSYADVPGKYHFEKYKKRGYDVDSMFINNEWWILLPDTPGFDWWEKNKMVCCAARNKQALEVLTAKSAPEVWNFVRMVNLWMTGGYYIDLSVLWIKPLPTNLGLDISSRTCVKDKKSDWDGYFVMHFEKRDPLLECALELMADLEACYKNNSVPGKQCLKDHLITCLGVLPKKSVDKYSFTSSESSLFVNWNGCDDNRINSLFHASSSNSRRANVDSMFPKQSQSGLWIGSRGLGKAWETPMENSVMDLLFSKFRGKNWKPGQKHSGSSSSPKTCSYISNNDSAKICAPGVIIPGVQKGASTFTFMLLMEHPLMLHPLGGKDYKEAGSYTEYFDTKIGYENRWERFPFIEPDENFLSIDASVSYMYSYRVPAKVFQDNPNARIIFALRNPTSRAWSDFKFLQPFYQQKKHSGTFDEVVEAELTFAKEYYHFEKANSNGVDLSELRSDLLSIGHSSVPEPVRPPMARDSTLVNRGVYVVGLLNWLKYFPINQIHIVTVEEFEKDRIGTINRAIDFLSLPKHDFKLSSKQNPTPKYKGVYAKNSTFIELQKFFKPYNQMLYKMIGRDLGWDSINPFQPSYAWPRNLNPDTSKSPNDKYLIK